MSNYVTRVYLPLIQIHFGKTKYSSVSSAARTGAGCFDHDKSSVQRTYDPRVFDLFPSRCFCFRLILCCTGLVRFGLPVGECLVRGFQPIEAV